MRTTDRPAVSAASGFSPAERSRRPDGVRKTTTHVTSTIASADPHEQVELAEDVAEERDRLDRQVDVRHLRQVVRRAVVAVDVDVQVAGDADREQVQRGAGDDLVGPERDREQRVQAAKTAPATIAITIPSSHEPVMSAPQAPKNAPISIMPSSAMLMTPERSENRPPSAPNSSGVA